MNDRAAARGRLRRAPFAALLLCLALRPGAGQAEVIRLPIEDYVVSVGAPNAGYFNGRLLTAGDLNEEQSYMRSADRYLGESDLPLGALFRPAGRADVALLLDEAEALAGRRTEVGDSHDRYADDFIVLQPDGRWFGSLYLDEYGGIVAGVYDDLSGTYEDLVLAPEPLCAGLLALGAAGALAARRRRPRNAA